ncbi:MAG: sigma-54-dependent Fis family transcriptional regulator [Thermodesulfatator sp.]|nr:MAG: sigma-54-dependent Fis family transcriptional regulator [Thermodesulfatator sp.]
MASFLIYIIDDEDITVQRLVRALSSSEEDSRVQGFILASEAIEAMRENPPDIVISDIRLKDADGIDLMNRIKSMAPNAAIILITGYPSIDQAVKATKKGAFYYLAKPFSLAELRKTVSDAKRFLTSQKHKDQLLEKIRKDGRLGEIIGTTPEMLKIFKTIKQVAPLDCNVLIKGETGTGKELAARALHMHSKRSSGPFMSFSCGAFTEELIANELFGHEKGAFTGATTTKLGLLEAASRGTVLLDEIGEMPLSMQVKLLRVLQENEIFRVGGTTPLKIDCRFIAATNRDLDKMVKEGEFRQDLYYRLKVVTLELPPLRDRRDDIPPLANHFARKAAKKFRKAAPAVGSDFVEALMTYPFPGNCRELEHIVERAVALSHKKKLTAHDLPPDLWLIQEPESNNRAAAPLKNMELDYIYDVYKKTGFNQSETARILGISRTTLWRKLRKMNINSGKLRQGDKKQR